jgi:pimeloyl-ACP methyl ester carboxylesterase
MTPIATENVIINGNRIAYGVYGEGDPVVLVHGTPSASIIWRNVVPELSKAGFKVHVFDLLGYGESERPWSPDVDTSISGQVPILEALLDHWGVMTVHLVAHDIGGGVAQRFGVFHNDRLRSLTMIDVVSFDSYPSRRTRQQMETGLAKLIQAPESDHREHFREWLLTASADPGAFEEGGALNAYLDYISGTVGQASLFQHQVRHYDPKHTMEIADRIHELGKVPVKLIWGEKDAWQNLEWAHRLKAAIPDSDLSVVEGAGHFSLEDKPQEISGLLLDFLGAHRTSISDLSRSESAYSSPG